jgi:glycogen operon protein
MLLAGDEFGRTQDGNNNAYGQDSEIGWINWEMDEEGRELAEFTRRMIALRQALPMLRRGRFLTGEFDESLGVKDVSWLTTTGEEMADENWTDTNARCLGVLLDGRAQPTGLRRPGTDSTLLLIVNSYHDVVNFKLPEAAGGREWVCLVDTNQPDLEESPVFSFGHDYAVTGRSLLLFMLKPVSARHRDDAVRSYRHVMAEYDQAWGGSLTVTD